MVPRTALRALSLSLWPLADRFLTFFIHPPLGKWCFPRVLSQSASCAACVSPKHRIPLASLKRPLISPIGGRGEDSLWLDTVVFEGFVVRVCVNPPTERGFRILCFPTATWFTSFGEEGDRPDLRSRAVSIPILSSSRAHHGGRHFWKAFRASFDPSRLVTMCVCLAVHESFHLRSCTAELTAGNCANQIANRSSRVSSPSACGRWCDKARRNCQLSLYRYSPLLGDVTLEDPGLMRLFYAADAEQVLTTSDKEKTGNLFRFPAL